MTHAQDHDFGVEFFCRDCRHCWWLDMDGEISECRLNPPVPVAGQALAQFPKVDIHNHWCQGGQRFGEGSGKWGV